MNLGVRLNWLFKTASKLSDVVFIILELQVDPAKVRLSRSRTAVNLGVRA